MKLDAACKGFRGWRRDMFTLEDFAFPQMVELGASLREVCMGAESMEEAAGWVVRHLYDCLISKETGQRACVLIRMFKTHSFGELDEGLRQIARSLLKDSVESPSMKCLVMLATAGDWPEWNSRERSKGHRAIPLPSAEAIATSFPMISQLVTQMGLSVSTLVKADPALMLDIDENSLGVFHVPQALGSPYVPAQKDFVVARGVQSVVGFGGLLPGGDLFAVILFSKVQIPRATAELFTTLGLITKLGICPFTHRVFADAPARHRSARTGL
jgi:hypothetical protein